MMKKVLHVEDYPHNRRLVRAILEIGGYEMVEAMDGPTGLEKARAEKPDLILTDIDMPGFDGLELTKRIKKDPELGQIPVIALTANAMVGDRERILAAGCDGYLAKPIGRRELLNKLAYYLDADSAAASQK